MKITSLFHLFINQLRNTQTSVMTSAMTLRMCTALQWLVNLNSGLRPKLSRLVSVFALKQWNDLSVWETDLMMSLVTCFRPVQHTWLCTTTMLRIRMKWVSLKVIASSTRRQLMTDGWAVRWRGRATSACCLLTMWNWLPVTDDDGDVGE